MGITKILRTEDSNDIPILIIIAKNEADHNNNSTIKFEIGETPYDTSKSCESTCRDYLSRNIISALQVFITDKWEQIKVIEEQESTTNPILKKIRQRCHINQGLQTRSSIF